MTGEPEVKCEPDPQSNSQWGKGLFFRIEGYKRTFDLKAVRIGTVVLTVFLFGILVMDPRRNPKENSNSNRIGLPQTTQQVYEIKPLEINSSGESEMRAKRSSGRRGYSRPQVLRRPRELSDIPPGSMIKAKLISGASNGLVRAENIEPLMVNGNVFIESGASFLGEGSSTEERLFIRFSNVVFDDGTYGVIDAQAADTSDKTVGLKGSMVGSYAWKMAGSVGLGFLGGLSEGLQDSYGQDGATVQKPSLKNALLKGTSTAALQQSQEFMSSARNETPIQEVDPDTELYLNFGIRQ